MFKSFHYSLICTPLVHQSHSATKMNIKTPFQEHSSIGSTDMSLTGSCSSSWLYLVKMRLKILTEKKPKIKTKGRSNTHIHSYFAEMLIHWVKKNRDKYIRTKGKCQQINKIQDRFCCKYLANLESFKPLKRQ